MGRITQVHTIILFSMAVLSGMCATTIVVKLKPLIFIWASWPTPHFFITTTAPTRPPDMSRITSRLE
jgi:hypothetical protein